MKRIYFILCSFLLLTSCGNNNSRDRMDLELREKELELKERELAIQRTEEREVMLENDNQTPRCAGSPDPAPNALDLALCWIS